MKNISGYFLPLISLLFYIPYAHSTDIRAMSKHTAMLITPDGLTTIAATLTSYTHHIEERIPYAQIILNAEKTQKHTVIPLDCAPWKELYEQATQFRDELLPGVRKAFIAAKTHPNSAKIQEELRRLEALLYSVTHYTAWVQAKAYPHSLRIVVDLK